jgi:hypothetical protein
MKENHWLNEKFKMVCNAADKNKNLLGNGFSLK